MRRGIPAGRSSSTWLCSISSPKTCRSKSRIIGLRGSHLPATLNMNQLGLDYINRAANDTTVCSLTGNVIIPQGQPGYTSTQRDTCYGAYLRQQVPNPFLGVIREGALSTATVQRNLLLVPFPAIQFGKPAWIFRRKQLQRVAAAGGQALRRRQRYQRELHILQELRQCGDGDRLARIGGRERGRRLPDQQSGERVRPEQLRRPAQVRRQLRLGLAVRRRPPVRRRGDRVSATRSSAGGR